MNRRHKRSNSVQGAVLGLQLNLPNNRLANIFLENDVRFRHVSEAPHRRFRVRTDAFSRGNRRLL